MFGGVHKSDRSSLSSNISKDHRVLIGIAVFRQFRLAKCTVE